MCKTGIYLYPHLINVYSEGILREIGNMPAVKVGAVNINNLRYADDIVLIVENEAALQNILNKVVSESERNVFKSI